MGRTCQYTQTLADGLAMETISADLARKSYNRLRQKGSMSKVYRIREVYCATTRSTPGGSADSTRFDLATWNLVFRSVFIMSDACKAMLDIRSDLNSRT